MNRNKFLIATSIILIVVILTIVGGYIYLTKTKAEPEIETVEVTGSLAENNLEVEEGSGNQNATTTLNSEGVPKLRHLTTTPVAGYDFVSKLGGYSIWYVDRSNGHIFETSTSSVSINKVTNTTIPKVYEALIGNGGASVILRTLNEETESIQTFIGTPRSKTIGTSTPSDSTKELVGVFTADVIPFISMAPDKDRFFGITNNSGSLGNIYTFGAKSTNVFSHPLKRWNPTWVNANTILMTSAPSAKTQNISYFLNPTTKAFTKLIGPKNGHVVSASPSANWLLFSENKENSLYFGIYDVKTGTETRESNGTIPDKCTWSKIDSSLAYCGFPKTIAAGIYPDNWYQGKVFFNDTLRTLDAASFQFNTIADLQNISGEPIDAINLTLSPDEKYIMFTNKRDMTLWMLEL